MPTPALAAATVPGDGALHERWFYVWMSGACLAVAVLGFLPTYFLPMAQGAFAAPPIIHIHGIVLFSWMLFFCLQAWRVAAGDVRGHRAWGVLGVAIATAMVFVVTAVVSLRVQQAYLPGQPAGLAHDVRAFAWVSFGVLAFFVPAFILAIVNIPRPEIHKRLMLLATISMLGAPIARWFAILLSPAPDPNAPPWPAGLPDVTPVPVSVALGPHLVGDLLLVVVMLHDWRRRGRPHGVYVVGGAILLLIQLTMEPVSQSPAWQAFAAAIGRLNG
jgi:hypothetical protein